MGGLEQRTQVDPDGTVLRSPIPNVMLPCDSCGDLLRFLTRFRGRALCRACLADEAKRGGRSYLVAHEGGRAATASLRAIA